MRKFDVSQGTEGATVRLNDTTEICDLDPDATSVTETCSSDARLKTNIREAEPVLNYLTGLPIKDFTVKASGENATGVIAQDLLENYPELVSMDDEYYMVKSLSPWLFVKAIQEQQAQIEELQKRIEVLENK